MTEVVGQELFSYVVGWFVRIFQSIWHLILRRVQGSRKGMIPPIRDQILLEPAIVLAEKIRTKKLKSETVVRAYIQRIQDVNPLLNAVVEEGYEAALEEARRVDNYIQTSGKTPQQLALEKPFLGVPFTTKEAIPVKGLAVTSGVVALKGVKAEADCEVVVNMRNAGAIPLCVTNVCELCFWIDGSNNAYGTTNNSYDLMRSPGGSTGGEAALLSAAASVVGLGNDIGGSVRVPCSYSGIFGHKPTRRVVPNNGQFPCTVGSDLDNYNCTGPMCRYSCDLLPMLKVMAGQYSSKLKLDTQVDLSKIKVYYTEDYISQGWTVRVDPEIKEAVRDVVRKLETTYGMQVKKVTIPHINRAWSIWLTKIGSVKIEPSFEDMCTNGKGSSFNLGSEFLKTIIRANDHTLNFLYLLYLCNRRKTAELEECNQANNILFDKLTEFFNEMLGNDGIFIWPTNPNTAMYHNEMIVKFTNFAYTGMFNFLGNPVTQCPIRLSSEGLPIGVQVVTNHHNDHLSLAVGRELEKIFGGWVSPSPVILQ